MNSFHRVMVPKIMSTLAQYQPMSFNDLSNKISSDLSVPKRYELLSLVNRMVESDLLLMKGGMLSLPMDVAESLPQKQPVKTNLENKTKQELLELVSTLAQIILDNRGEPCEIQNDEGNYVPAEKCLFCKRVIVTALNKGEKASCHAPNCPVTFARTLMDTSGELSKGEKKVVDML